MNMVEMPAQGPERCDCCHVSKALVSLTNRNARAGARTLRPPFRIDHVLIGARYRNARAGARTLRQKRYG